MKSHLEDPQLSFDLCKCHLIFSLINLDVIIRVVTILQIHNLIRQQIVLYAVTTTIYIFIYKSNSLTLSLCFADRGLCKFK